MFLDSLVVGVKEGYVHNRMTGKVYKRALENEKRVSAEAGLASFFLILYLLAFLCS